MAGMAAEKTQYFLWAERSGELIGKTTSSPTNDDEGFRAEQ